MQIEDIKRMRAVAHHIAQARDALNGLPEHLRLASLEYVVGTLDADRARIFYSGDAALTPPERESLEILRRVIALSDPPDLT